MISPRLRNTLLCIDACIAFIVIWILVFAYVDHPKAGPKQTIEIRAGASVEEVADQLVSKGVISAPRTYRVLSWFHESAKYPRPGVYALQPGTNYLVIARTLALGPEKEEAQVRIIEGWTLNDISSALLLEHTSSTAIEASMGKQADRAPFASAWREEFPFLSALPLKRSLEGYLFPNTYRVWQAQLPESLIRKQLKEFSTRYGTSTISNTLQPLKTLDDIVILASIVEKEVRTPEERRRVAGIFLRRLRLGMPLQSDATLTYITGSKRDRATAQELAMETPYNSYKSKGLPPSPICNPAASAIDAVLNPVIGKDLYFLTDENGTVYYAATFDEHVRNKRRVGI